MSFELDEVNNPEGHPVFFEERFTYQAAVTWELVRHGQEQAEQFAQSIIDTSDAYGPVQLHVDSTHLLNDAAKRLIFGFTEE